MLTFYNLGASLTDQIHIINSALWETRSGRYLKPRILHWFTSSTSVYLRVASLQLPKGFMSARLLWVFLGCLFYCRLQSNVVLFEQWTAVLILLIKKYQNCLTSAYPQIQRREEKNSRVTFLLKVFTVIVVLWFINDCFTVYSASFGPLEGLSWLFCNMHASPSIFKLNGR